MGVEARCQCRKCRQKRGLVQHQSALASNYYGTIVLQHQSATPPECYGIKEAHNQSGATSMTLFRWHTEAWVAVGRTQKVPEKKWKWWFWRNTNGDSGEIQTPEARGIRVRLGGNGGRREKLNIIEWEIYLGNLPRQKVPDNYFFPLERFVFPSVRKNEA